LASVNSADMSFIFLKNTALEKSLRESLSSILQRISFSNH